MKAFLKFSRSFALPEWPWYLAGTIFLAITNYLTLQIPLLAKYIVDHLEDPTQNTTVISTSVAMIQLGLLLIIIRTLSRLLIFWPGRRIEANVKSYLFARIMDLPQAFQEKFGLGDLISRLSNDVAQLRAFFAFGILQALNLIFLLTFTINQMITTHATLTWLCLAPLILMFIIMRYLNPVMYRFSLESQAAMAGLTNRVTETLVNVHVVQANAASEAMLAKMATDNSRVYAANMKVLIARQIFWPLIALLAGFSQAIILIYGGYEVVHDRLSVGDILAFNVYIGYLAFPLSALGIIVALYQQCRAALERIQIIENEPLQTSYPAYKASSETDLLVIKNLNYKYPSSQGDEPFALKNISFTVREGEHVGIFGSIGSGKSTIFDLLTRLKDPPRDTIYWQGQDIFTIPLEELRHKISYALQSPELLSDSVRENLKLGMPPDISDEALRDAAREAYILDEIEKLPEGWETRIGERGIRLSGGQKHRLALARLFLRDSELLLLDDVLAAVDHTTEKHLIAAIHRRKCALLIASHRASVLRACDKILVIENGELIHQGTFAEVSLHYPHLMREKGETHES